MQLPAEICPCSPDVGDCPRCSSPKKGGGISALQNRQGREDILRALDLLFSLPLGVPPVKGSDFLSYFERLLHRHHVKRQPTRKGRSKRTKTGKPISTRKQTGGNGALQQALFAIAGYDIFQGTPCESILGCVNIVLMAVSVFTIAVEFQRAYRGSASTNSSSRVPNTSSVLGRIQRATTQALGSEAVANSIASPLRWLTAQLTPRGLVRFDQMFDVLNTAVQRMVSLLTLNMIVEEGMPATGIGAVAVGILRWQINTQLHLRYVEAPIACALMEAGVPTCQDRCRGVLGSVQEL